MKFKFNTVILEPGTQWWLSRPHHMTMLPSTMTMRGVFFLWSVLSCPPHSHLPRKDITVDVARLASNS